ncbi:MAG: RagB/SusD family nutrient uptake outer membrane protein [Bacteroidales bacterium]|nr:RagB/SusD family nutrient uptake outer membrane protein [Bacteroidales bacterium]MDD6131541.1 RagB/SusD family nutrient uptake outer membrane protein [Bacteroidales bacterium]MDD6850694.1 RagB/SusD family nutrient uptake outer membrane protein [Bacteroidales bacterium]MDY2930806.1 RagB/SusD family nutrient uptake outer membrane protein [Muribaculaceae bacterium]
MKLNLLKYTAFCVAALALASCNDFLDKVPDTRVELNSPEQLRLLMVNAYPSSNYSLVCEFSSDNYIDNNSPDENGMRYNLSSYNRIDDELFAWEDAKASSGNDTPSDIWEAYYHSIACANAVLEKIPEFEANTELKGRDMLPAIKGEALLVRAFSHFILANLFCEAYRGPELSKNILGIPYITEPETIVHVVPERGNLADVYDMIEKDLLEGISLINDGLYEVPKYHFNKAAANAFAARFYLFKRDYKKVLAYCDAAFGGPDVDPTPYMSDIWNQVSNFYYISDFGRYQTNITQQRNFMLIATYSTWLRHISGSKRYGCNREAKRATIQGPGPTWSQYQWRNSKGETFAMHPCFNGACGTNGKSEYGLYFAGTAAELFEYTDKLAGIGFAHQVRAEFTGEETLITRAEAKAYLGDIEGAIADLKIWDQAHRNSPNVTPGEDHFDELTYAQIVKFYQTKDPGFGIVKTLNIDEICPSTEYAVNDNIEPLLQCVLHYRRIELIHTGMRWFDLKRYGIEISHAIGKEPRIETLTKLDPRRALQIPNEVIAAGIEPNNRSNVALSSGAEYSKITPEPKAELISK